MRRRKPVDPQPITSDPRFTLRGHASVQQLPPTQPNPRTKLSHSVKAVPSSVSGNVVPIARRAPVIKLFFGAGGGVRFRK